MKSQEGVKTEKLASEGLVSYNTEPALEMASEAVSQPAESYETQPALEMTPATPGKEEESYEVTGDTLKWAGIKLSDKCSGSGYRNGMRVMPDFSSRVYIIKKI